MSDPQRISRLCFFFQAEDGIRDRTVTGVQTCALPISRIPEGFGLVLPHTRRVPVEPTGPFAGSGLPLSEGGRTSATIGLRGPRLPRLQRSEERRVGKSVDLGGRRVVKKKK